MIDRPVRLHRFGPLRPWFRPGATARLDVELSVGEGMVVEADVALLDLDRVVRRVVHRWRLPVGRSSRGVAIVMPSAARRGYGLRLVLRRLRGARPVAVAESALEALDGWWEAPRHAAITDFRDARRARDAVRALRDWHVTVVQHYDWMYRHYRYRPPHGDVFDDPLGRRVSHRVVGAVVREGAAVGIASLAYGAVYGAEREYADAHPAELVVDESGKPHSLGEMFFVTDPRPGAWRQRLLREYAAACRSFGFDGIHMDTYGPPHRGFAPDGEPIDFAAVYPGLIDEAAARVAAARPGARVLFNCVDGFPLDAVARAPTAALYIELWPRDGGYADVVRWIDHAHQAGAGKQVVVAAYISALRAAGRDAAARSPAVEAAVLLTCVIAAAGGHHHVIAEGGRLLVEGYYPEARRLARREAAELRAAWTFAARYVHLLSDPARRPATAVGIEVRDEHGQPVSVNAAPIAGRVWLRTSTTPAGRVLQLVDLTVQAGDRWDDLRQPSPMRRGWTIWLPGWLEPVAASPWSRRGAAAPMAGSGQGPKWRLPPFRRWLTVAEGPRLPASDPG